MSGASASDEQGLSDPGTAAATATAVRLLTASQLFGWTVLDLGAGGHWAWRLQASCYRCCYYCRSYPVSWGARGCWARAAQVAGHWRALGTGQLLGPLAEAAAHLLVMIHLLACLLAPGCLLACCFVGWALGVSGRSRRHWASPRRYEKAGRGLGMPVPPKRHET